jgi:hypothetical protein
VTLAERLLRIVEMAGFDRLKRSTKRRAIVWELWLSDGAKQIHEAPTLADVIAKAEAQLGVRKP